MDRLCFICWGKTFSPFSVAEVP